MSPLPAQLELLIKAYPDLDASRCTSQLLVWNDGTSVPISPQLAGRPDDQQLADATIRDQLLLVYPKGWPFEVPRVNHDPGRLRCDAFFRKVYGAAAKDVERQLIRVPWPPAGQGASVPFSNANGAAEALRKVGEELSTLTSEIRTSVNRPCGTYNWRTIAGADRPSPHSFGIAIDFTLPKHLHRYWLWGRGKNGGEPIYPAEVLDDTAMRAIVETFEKHGFIWGGKWYHYDLMHFEYRPELL
ncbi:MAG: M15 family metallopeptidase [Candidatus Hydrogenedentes bacterium]|nr:M15 family metallopeptidase [Candidatus Hydrogenedentota bacterium]